MLLSWKTCMFPTTISRPSWVDLPDRRGEIVCIIGANGAGKTPPCERFPAHPCRIGTKMTFMGRNLLEYPADKVVSELGISHVRGRRLFDNLTILENLRLATFARRDGRAIGEDLDRVFSIFPRLFERQNQKAGTLSAASSRCWPSAGHL